MKSLYSFLLFLTAPLLAVSQTHLYVDSTRFITGNKPGTGISFTIATKDKGILFVGNDFSDPGGMIPFFPLDTGVNGNVLIGKIDSDQKISWIKVYGGSGIDIAISACQTADSGYAVLAYTESNNGDIHGYKDNGDLWLLRLDQLGNLLWEKTYGSFYQEEPISIASTPDSGFIILGVSDGNGGDIPAHYGSLYSFDWVVIKTDDTGHVQWAKNFGTTDDEGRDGAIISKDSSYYLIGAAHSIDKDCVDTAWHSAIGTGYDICILKLNDTGCVLWSKSYGGTGSENAKSALYDDKDTSIVVAGWTVSNDLMVTGNHGDSDFWVIKVNKDGTLRWQRTFGNAGNDACDGLCPAPNHGYAIYGGTGGGIGGADGLVVVIDSNGGEITTKIFGGSSSEMPCTIVPYLNGYAAAGISSSDTFTQGLTSGRNCAGQESYISYISLRPILVDNFIGSTTDLETHLVVFPNPASGVVNVAGNVKNGSVISVFNNMGQTVYGQTFEQDTRSVVINANSWNSGVYFIRLSDRYGFVQTAKLVKK